jgi:hypothetical protein
VAVHEKTRRLVDLAHSILAVDNPMTVRQVFYQLVSRQAIENSKSAYNAVCNLLARARRDGDIPWEWIEDRMRRPRHVPMWDDLPDFGETVRRSYRRDVWPEQPVYIEAWLEKDALSGIFEDVLKPYGVTLNVGRGYDGWSSIHNAAERFGDGEGVTVLYFGDFDPSGDDMVRSLRKRLSELQSRPEIIKVALTAEDVERYNLPSDPTKAGDTRRGAFILRNGDRAVELDALPAQILRGRLKAEVEARMDLDALAGTREVERSEVERLVEVMASIGRDAE